MKSFAVAVALVVLAAARTAIAQPGATPPAVYEGELSESRALALSLGGTAASWALIIAGGKIGESDEDVGGRVAMVGGLGSMLAPSFGHWYRGDYFTRGMGLRLLGVGTSFVGFITMFTNAWSGSEEGFAVGIGLAIAGGGLFVGGTVDDILQAPKQVRLHNGRIRGLALVPSIQRDGGGLSLSGSF
jgi:hypothetical protein